MRFSGNTVLVTEGSGGIGPAFVAGAALSSCSSIERIFYGGEA
jgi:hypothetical protein